MSVTGMEKNFVLFTAMLDISENTGKILTALTIMNDVYKEDVKIMKRRERRREATQEEIRSVAWKQIAKEGVSALSWRAIARVMDMTAPALYRYYASRDDLVTALIVEAFDSFSQQLEAARDALPPNEPINRLRAVCRAYFDWAVKFPSRYALLFGSPVPGYRLGQAAYPSAQRGFLVLQTVLGEAVQRGRIRPRAGAVSIPADLRARYETLRQAGMPHDPLATHLALTAWSVLHGVTSLYLYGYMGSFLAEQVSTFVDSQIDQLVTLFGARN